MGKGSPLSDVAARPLEGLSESNEVIGVCAENEWDELFHGDALF